MRELRRIDVLLNEKTGERFNEDDIVKIHTQSKEWIGRIHNINSSQLILDMSKEYKSTRLDFTYDEIVKIEKL